jgi:hypothetical protein
MASSDFNQRIPGASFLSPAAITTNFPSLMIAKEACLALLVFNLINVNPLLLQNNTYPVHLILYT